MKKNERKAILTNVPAQVRTEVRVELKKEHKKAIIETIICCVIFGMYYAIYALLGSGDGVPAGIILFIFGMLAILDTVWEIKDDNDRWGVPTTEEFNEFGDRIV